MERIVFEPKNDAARSNLKLLYDEGLGHAVA
jgi:hypothetical protein